MPAEFSVAGEVAHLVSRKSVFAELLAREVVHICDHIVVGRISALIEHSALLDGERVHGRMRTVCRNRVDRVFNVGGGLLRQSEYNVGRNIAKTVFYEQFRRFYKVGAGMNPADGAKYVIVGGLQAHAYPVDARLGALVGKSRVAAFGIGFDGDLRRRRNVERVSDGG